jgi:hypothetical protein
MHAHVCVVCWMASKRRDISGHVVLSVSDFVGTVRACLVAGWRVSRRSAPWFVGQASVVCGVRAIVYSIDCYYYYR